MACEGMAAVGSAMGRYEEKKTNELASRTD